MNDRLAQMGYDAARRLLLLAGCLVLLVVATVMYARRVDSVEVVATLLFIPIFLALMYKGVLGGLVAAVAASIAYALLRADAIDAVGFDEFAGLIASRSASYLIFGLFGGWCNQTLESSLDKLELYDEIDDDTGLGNARFFLKQTDLEIARARRYQTLFSVVRVEIPATALAGLERRRRRALLRELGRLLREGVRNVDHVAHGRLGDRHMFAAVLPETAGEGAEVFRARFSDRLREFLAARGASLAAADLASSSCTIPGGEAVLDEMRAAFARIDEHEHTQQGTVRTTPV
jgi:hypothetical protein